MTTFKNNPTFVLLFINFIYFWLCANDHLALTPQEELTGWKQTSKLSTMFGESYQNIQIYCFYGLEI